MSWDASIVDVIILIENTNYLIEIAVFVDLILGEIVEIFQ